MVICFNNFSASRSDSSKNCKNDPYFFTMMVDISFRLYNLYFRSGELFLNNYENFSVNYSSFTFKKYSQEIYLFLSCVFKNEQTSSYSI